MSLLEIKLEKFRGKMNGDIDESKLKKVEMKRCNEYCFGAIRLFAHFTSFYAKTGDPKFYVDSVMPPLGKSSVASARGAADYGSGVSGIINESSSGYHCPEVAIAAASSEVPLEYLGGLACQDPDFALVAPEEVRPFLNAHFFSARMLSKVLPYYLLYYLLYDFPHFPSYL